MIRKFKIEDLENVLRIWLDTNIKAHNFIDENYWKNNFEMVKSIFPQAEIYVYEEKEILGFIGLDGTYIAGIFVESKFQSQGIGKKLLDYVKNINSELSLSVYVKNEKAVDFYKREDFKIKEEKIDENTGEKEYFMIWKK